ncbi:MAG: nucleoside monophosphate kinase [Patescibacteria group bacterium]|nr:nucleoside monophosphate kinase [Patescibacteria group bacterium]
MANQAVIIYGPPGSGKGTQAELLVRKFSFIHFDTGRYGESLIYAPGAEKNTVLLRERENFETGKLFTPSWTLRIVSQATRRIAKAGFGIVYSGSPRTMFEAFGDKNNKGLLSILIKLYGKKNIIVVELKVKSQTSIERNSKRVVCSVCGLPILASSKNKKCSFCAGPARKRTLDKPEIIKVRLKEYRERTYPILKKMRSLGFRIREINGEPSPYKVYEQVVRRLGLRR